MTATVTAKKLLLRPFVKPYLKQQLRYVSDLKKAPKIPFESFRYTKTEHERDRGCSPPVPLMLYVLFGRVGSMGNTVSFSPPSHSASSTSFSSL